MSEGMFGQRDITGLAKQAPEVDLSPSDDVRLEDVQVFNTIFEIPMLTARRRLPPSVRSSIPALVYFTFWRCAGGPLGAFEFSFAGLSCRTGVKPRFLTHGAFTDSEVAADFFRKRYGFPVREARVRMRENYDRLGATIHLNGTPALEIIATRVIPLVGLGSFVKYSPVLNIARTAQGFGLVQVETSYEFKRVLRGAPSLVAYNAGALGDSEVQPTTPVSASHAVVNMTLHPVRYLIDPTKSAETGGVRKLDRKDPSAA